MITITETAKKEIKSIIDSQEQKDFHLRVGIGGVGCSGYQYFLGLDSEVRDSDDTYDFEGFKLLIEKATVPLLDGSTIDYNNDENNTGFTFNNPNAPKPPECAGSCHC